MKDLGKCVFFIYKCEESTSSWNIWCSLLYTPSACMLLKINLYCENRFWLYLVDLVAIIFVSWIVIIAKFILVNFMIS